MYAVFRSGGKQYRASEGERVRVERLDAQEGDTVEFDQILMIGDGADVKLGAPLVQDSYVKGVVTSQGRGKKVVVTKFKRRKNYKRIMGHRQHYTEVQITSIGAEAPAVQAKASRAGKAKAAKATEAKAPKSSQAKAPSTAKATVAKTGKAKAPSTAKATVAKTGKAKAPSTAKTTAKKTSKAKAPSATKTTAKKTSKAKAPSATKTTAKKTSKAKAPSATKTTAKKQARQELRKPPRQKRRKRASRAMRTWASPPERAGVQIWHTKGRRQFQERPRLGIQTAGYQAVCR